MKKRLFFFCAVAMVVGIIIGSYAKEFTPLFLVPLALLPFFVFKRLFKFALVTLLLVISLTNSACAYKEFHNELPDAFVVGIVSDASGGENKSFVLSDTNVVLDGSTLDIDRVLVYFSGEELPSCGQWVKIRTTLYPLGTTAKNPGEKSTHTQAIADDIFFCAYSTNFDTLYKETTLKSIIYSLKGKIYDKIFSSTDNKEAAGILYAFLTGDRAYVLSSTRTSFRYAGASHLLALSGLHTGIIILFLTKLLNLFRASHKLKLVIVGTFLVLFCIFTGLSPSIIRASIMAVVLLFCSAAGFRYDLLNSLSLAACIILLFNPYRLFDVSFLLSFSAVLGIACLPKVKIKNKILSYLVSSLLLSLGATIFTVPLSLYYFSSVSVMGILFNLIMIPIASLALFALIIVIFLPAPLMRVPVFLASLLLEVSSFATRFNPVSTLAFDEVWVAVIMAAMFILSRFTQIKRLIKALVALLLCVAVFACAAIKDTASRINVIAQTSELCVHVSGHRNFLIGVSESGSAISYIKSNMRFVDIVVLLDDDDVVDFELARQKGIRFGAIIAPESIGSIDTELDVTYLRGTHATAFDAFFLFFDDGGLYLITESQIFFFGGESERATFSIFHTREGYQSGFCTVKTKHKEYSTKNSGMITVRRGKITTFLGDNNGPQRIF